jgi:hypothetical protein
MKPGNFKDISVSRLLHFVQSVGLLNKRIQALHKGSELVDVHGMLWCPPYFYSILFYSTLDCENKTCVGCDYYSDREKENKGGKKQSILAPAHIYFPQPRHTVTVHILACVHMHCSCYTQDNVIRMHNKTNFLPPTTQAVMYFQYRFCTPTLYLFTII